MMLVFQGRTPRMLMRLKARKNAGAASAVFFLSLEIVNASRVMHINAVKITHAM
jgi:hypothetical protein